MEAKTAKDRNPVTNLGHSAGSGHPERSRWGAATVKYGLGSDTNLNFNFRLQLGHPTIPQEIFRLSVPSFGVGIRHDDRTRGTADQADQAPETQSGRSVADRGGRPQETFHDSEQR